MAPARDLLGMYGVDQYILQYDNELQPPWKDVEPYLKMSYPFLRTDKIRPYLWVERRTST